MEDNIKNLAKKLELDPSKTYVIALNSEQVKEEVAYALSNELDRLGCYNTAVLLVSGSVQTAIEGVEIKGGPDDDSAKPTA